MRLEQLPLLKTKIEEFLTDLLELAEKSIEEINWQVGKNIGERVINIKISPNFKELPNESKFGETWEKGSDTVGKPRDEDMKYPNPF